MTDSLADGGSYHRCSKAAVAGRGEGIAGMVQGLSRQTLDV